MREVVSYDTMSTAVSTPSAAATAAPVPAASRERYVDLLRVVAATAVVVGHWLNAVITYEDGRLDVDYLLLAFPGTQYLTWLFQVMPLFFLVGGYANAASWRSAQRRGEPAAVWLRARWRRLLVPTAVLVGGWVALGLGLVLAGVDVAVILTAARHALGVLWFLGIYVFVVTAVPTTLRLHDRYGWRVVAALVALASATDIARLAFGVPLIGWANCAWVWLAMHQLGYLWQDRTLVRSAYPSWGLLLGGMTAFGLLVSFGPYSVNLVDRTNTTPPSLALLALGFGHTGLALMLRGAAERWLRGPRTWVAVSSVNRMVMTVYLWHATALMLIVLAFVVPDLWPEVPTATAAWWALRPLWLLAALAATLPLVAGLARLERPARAGRR